MPHAGEGRVSRNRVSLGQSKGTGTGICMYSLSGVLVSFLDPHTSGTERSDGSATLASLVLCIWVLPLAQLPH